MGSRDVLEELIEQLVLVACFDRRAALAVDRHLNPMSNANRHGVSLHHFDQANLKGEL